MEEEIVSGGGVALVRGINVLAKTEGDNLDQNTDIKIVWKALEEPLRQLVNNAGIEGSVVLQKVKERKDDFGFNAQTEKYET